MVMFDFDSITPKTASASVQNCYDFFDSKEAKGLSIDSFRLLLSSLLVDRASGQRYNVPELHVIEMFAKFDANKDSFIDRQEFEEMWKTWIAVILWPVSALLVVDVQNDFITGSLALAHCPAKHKGEEAIVAINRLTEAVTFEVVVYSIDWHPADHVSYFVNHKKRKIISRNGVPVTDPESLKDLSLHELVTFEGPPKTTQELLPVHCLQNSPGAELHPDLKVIADSIKIYKGINADIDSYSAFTDNEGVHETDLKEELLMRRVTDVYVCGVALDICVAATARHANEFGFRTVLVEDACRGINLKNIVNCKSDLISRNCVIVDSNRVDSMVKGKDRRPELAYHLVHKIQDKLYIFEPTQGSDSSH